MGRWSPRVSVADAAVTLEPLLQCSARLLSRVPTVDDLGEMRNDAMTWAAAATEQQSVEKLISKEIKVSCFHMLLLLSDR